MIIQNKKTLKTYELTKAEWEKIKSLKLHTLYKVIDASDSVSKVTKINVPKEITEFQGNLRIEKQTKPKKPKHG